MTDSQGKNNDYRTKKYLNAVFVFQSFNNLFKNSIKLRKMI